MKVLYNGDTIGAFTVGRVVRHKIASSDYRRVGHVKNFGLNALDEVIIFVKWCTGEIGSTHPNNLELL